MDEPASSTTTEICLQAHKQTAVSTSPHPKKAWEQFVDNIYSILKRTRLEIFYHHINYLHENSKFTNGRRK